MNKKQSLIGVIILVCCINYLDAAYFFKEPQQSLFMGTVQWPMTLKKVPSLRIYHAGHQLVGEINNELRQMSFSVPELRDTSLFTFIIAEPQYIKPHTSEDNTIQYLALTKDAPYKCFQIMRSKELVEMAGKGSTQTLKEGWRVEQRRLHDDGRIPDNALILCTKPEYIEELSGGNSIDLPTIRIASDIVKKVGTEEALHETADTLLLTCLNLDTLHTKLTFDIKDHQEKKLVAFNIM